MDRESDNKNNSSDGAGDEPAFDANAYEKVKAENQALVDAGGSVGVAEFYPVELPGGEQTLTEFLRLCSYILGHKEEAVYLNNGRLVEVDWRNGALVEVDLPRLRNLTCEHIAFFRQKWNGKAEEWQQIPEQSPALDTIKSLDAGLKKSADVKEIITVTDSPCYLPGWEMIKPGWNVGGFFYVGKDAEDLDKVAEYAQSVADAPLETVHKMVDSLLVDFPFATEGEDGDLQRSSRDNFIGAIVSTLIRPCLDSTVPMFVAGATKARTGKTLMVRDLYGALLFAKEMAQINYTDNEYQLEQKLISKLTSGTPTIFFDNVDDEVASSVLAQALTSRVFSGRELGRSRMLEPTALNTTFWMTANNCTFSHDMSGRICKIDLTPLDDAPERRSDFEHPDIRAYVQKNRVMLLGLFCGMVERWRNAGCPLREENIMGSFEKWSRVVGGILDTNGYEDFQKGWSDTIASSSANYDIADFFQAIIEGHGKPVPGQHVPKGKKERILDRLALTTEDLLAIARSEGNPHFEKPLEKVTQAGKQKSMGAALRRLEGSPYRVGDEVLALRKRRTKQGMLYTLSPYSTPGVEMSPDLQTARFRGVE